MDLLVTKLAPPVLPRPLVARPRLLDRLDAATGTRVAAVGADAGTGKTTLATAWAEQASSAARPVAWLSLEARDSEPRRFWRYMIAALARLGVASDEVGISLPAQIGEPNAPEVEGFLHRLINALADSDRDGALVLDDFHHVTDPPVVEELRYFIDHLPANTHIVLLTRRDLPWSLDTMRMRSEVEEIAARDLRFTASETVELFDGVARVAVSADDAAALVDVTEGWAGALKLAALALRRGGDVDDLIAGLARGTPRYLIDFLVNDVLAGQPPDVREFVLESGVLGEFSIDLCNEVCGRTDAAEMAERICAEHLFLEPADATRTRYRYHQIVAQVLRHQLRSDDPGRAVELHRRTSHWFELGSDIDAAIRHARLAGDTERVAELILRHAAERGGTRGEHRSVTRWADDLSAMESPPTPGTITALTWANIVGGRIIEAEARLSRIEGAETAVDDRTQAEATVCGLMLAYALGDFDSILETTDDALARPDEPGRLDLRLDRLWMEQRGRALMLTGRWDQARVPLFRGLGMEGRPWDPPFIIIPGLLALIEDHQGRLRRCERFVETALHRAAETGAHESPFLSAARVAGARVAWERNEIVGSGDELRADLERGFHPTDHWATVFARLTVARALMSVGRSEAADAVYRVIEADQPWAPLPAGVRAMLAVERLENALVGEDADAAARWRDELQSLPGHRVEASQDVRTTALVEGAARAAPDVDRLVAGLEMRESRRHRLDLLIAAALIYLDTERHADAITALARATAEAEPEGFVRRFLEAGAPLEPLMRELTKGVRPRPCATRPFLELLVAAYDAAGSGGSDTLILDTGADALSDRERQVLGMLATNLTLGEIGDELCVSPNTVKTHVRHVYRKLGVGTRREAVQRLRAQR